MKIALVHDFLTNFAGAEQVLLALHELYPEAPIFTALYDSEKCPQFRGADVRTSFLQHLPKVKEKVLIPLMPLAVEGYDLSEFDVVISDSHLAAKGVVTKPETIHICYCHTPIRYAWSPEIDPRASRSWLRRAANHYLRLWDTYAAKRVNYWVANSSYVASRIKKYYRAESTVIHPPVNVHSFQITRQLDNYFVYFSRLIDYKRPELVIEAFNQLGKPLKVMGRGPELARLKAMAKPNIEFMGYVSDLKLREVFAQAQALIFPVEEDFGIIPVEFMAAGRPVIAYQAGGMLDVVVPGKTGEFMTEQSVEAIVQAVAAFDPLGYDSEVIRAEALRFDKQVFKHRMRQFVDAAVKKGI